MAYRGLGRAVRPVKRQNAITSYEASFVAMITKLLLLKAEERDGTKYWAVKYWIKTH